MGNIISLCVKKSETDQEHSEQSKKMAKDAVYETTTFDGQKPGTSGKLPVTIENVPLICRIEKESQGVYAEELHREFCSGLTSGGVVIDGRLFLRQFLLQGQREPLSLLVEMVVTTTKRSCKSSPKWLLQMEYRSQLRKN